VIRGQMVVDRNALEDEIARLRDLDLPNLRARWRTVFRRKAPDLPRHLLFRILAYRLQANVLAISTRRRCASWSGLLQETVAMSPIRFSRSSPACPSRDPCSCGSGKGRRNASWSLGMSLPASRCWIDPSVRLFPYRCGVQRFSWCVSLVTVGSGKGYYLCRTHPNCGGLKCLCIRRARRALRCWRKR
jgi:hypothetical protein